MKKLSRYFIILSLSIAVCLGTQAQEKVEIEGAIQIGTSQDPAPDPGTIRWTGYNFEGFTGAKWVSLTQFNIASIITDIDGNTYRTVQIGSQEWMAQNLRTSKYRNDDAIPNVTNDTDWQNLASGAYCWYDNDNSYEQPYGKLYNWYAVNDARGLCPAGWHEPTDAEWEVLRDYLDPNAVGNTNVAGGKMKEVGLAHWNSPNTAATNESSFTGLPGGYRDTDGQFFSIGSVCNWWSSSQYFTFDAWFRVLGSLEGFVNRYYVDKGLGLSVRCLRDD